MARYEPRQSDTYGTNAPSVVTWSHIASRTARPPQIWIGIKTLSVPLSATDYFRLGTSSAMTWRRRTEQPNAPWAHSPHGRILSMPSPAAPARGTAPRWPPRLGAIEPRCCVTSGWSRPDRLRGRYGGPELHVDRPARAIRPDAGKVTQGSMWVTLPVYSRARMRER